jgi:hypothetical protein
MYSQAKYYAILHFDIEVKKSQISKLNGQVYYTSTSSFKDGKIKNFTLHHHTYNKKYCFNIPIELTNIKYIRLDPLDNKGIVSISNIYNN